MADNGVVAPWVRPKIPWRCNCWLRGFAAWTETSIDFFRRRSRPPPGLEREEAHRINVGAKFSRPRNFVGEELPQDAVLKKPARNGEISPS